jgi:hypothetical protein
MLGMTSSYNAALFADQIIPYLLETWLNHYDLAGSGGEVAHVHVNELSYFFDIGPDRLIAAWGISEGRFAGDRDKSRMQGYPVTNRPVYHAGHAIPHRFGGGTDINLTAQLGKVNIGPFREIETRAVRTPGSLYFTYWMYGRDSTAQLAQRVQQGLLIPGSHPEIRIFKNR